MKPVSYRHFIALIVISAIAITGFSAAPAQAGQKDLNRALAALAGLAVLGVVIHEVRKDDRKESRRSVDRRYDRDDHLIERVYPGRPVKPLPRRVERKLLPQDCLRSVDAKDGRLHVFGRRCLKRNYAYADRLPEKCERRFRAGGEKRVGYEARCLRREGYALARY